MFDPTAFENLKIVIEGAVYDKDLNGEILVVDRNDVMNLAKLERCFDITFIDKKIGGKEIKAKWILTAPLENLAAELLDAVLSEKMTGCHVTVQFELNHRKDWEIFNTIKQVLEDIWGESRTIEQSISLNPFIEKQEVNNIITIRFNRLVHEDQMQDLTAMIEFMIKSIRALRKIFKS